MMLLPSCSGTKRRAQWSPSGNLVLYILAIIVLVILIIIYGGIVRPDLIDKEACRQSIKLNAYSKLETRTGTDLGKYIVDPYGNAVKLQCATEYLEVRGTDPEILKKKIADSMVDCWQMYGEGDLEVFNTEDNNYCAVCSRLEFKEKTQLPGFTQYLTSNVAPMQDTTYMEYFQGSGRRCGADTLSQEEIADLVDQSGLNELDTLDTSSPLAVMFVMNKNAYPDSIFGTGKLETAAWGVGAGVLAGIALCLTVVGCSAGGPIIAIASAAFLTGTAAAGGAAGYALGSACTADYDAYVMLWNYSDLASLDCDYLESESTPLKIREI